MWSLYEEEKELAPLVFSNGKSQADVVQEVLDAVKEDYKIIFIKGICGTGKSAIALNLARKLGKTSIVVPIKSLQEQYTRDYSDKKYILKHGKESEKTKLKISSIVGRQNFKCNFLNENDDLEKILPKEENLKLNDIFSGHSRNLTTKQKSSCDSKYLPCTIELREKNLPRIKELIKRNPAVKLSNFESISDVKRMTIAPVCPYWSPILPEELEIKKFKDAVKKEYIGLSGKKFIIYFRKKGCPYYDQYSAYADSDVIIFNSLKYKIESLMQRKPKTELDIIDECDEFLDSLTEQEQININRLLFSLSFISPKEAELKEIIERLRDLANAIKNTDKYKIGSDEIYELKNTLIQELLETMLINNNLLDEIELDDSNYLFHLDKIARTFYDFFEESFFSLDKRDNDLIINLVTTNLEKRLKYLVEKNKTIVMMSGTIHSENVLKNIFGIDKFKIIEAETQNQGELIKCRNGYEMDCSYESFKSNRTTRPAYLKALSSAISCAKRPTLVHVNAFSDLPTDSEKINLNLTNLPSQREFIEQQNNDPLGKIVYDFKNKKNNILFTTKCNRGIDFPGEICNSIVITRFPYPNISALFWKILKRNKPTHFMSFYMDKAKRELLQKIYRGLRSKEDKIQLLSPDIRVLEFNFENQSDKQL